MGIYRGIGGTGDSTSDATLEAVTQKAVEAEASADAAAISETNAAASASSAQSYAGNAATSATAAAASAASADSDSDAAEAARLAAVAAQTAAETAQANAETAETNAETAQTAAETAETNAETAATNAASSASTATTQASNAASSATSSATSAAASASSATTATTKASEAATSATNAASSATSAATSATNASSSASAAATSAAIADGDATTATTQANLAYTSATQAANSAVDASDYASLAGLNMIQAQAAFDSFDDRYLGAKASDPSVDNDGNALIEGALYFNSTDDVMKVYDGSAWIAAYVSLSGALLAANNLSDVDSVSTSRTNLGLGTVATQDANNVAITGGSINGAPIGATTPAAGTFTTLTATTAGTTTAKVWSNTGTSPIADLELQRGTTSTWGGDAFTDYRLRASGGNFILQSQNNTTSVLDLLTVDETNNAIKFSPVGVEQMRVTRTASAVNYVQVTGSATTLFPNISAQGSDTNIGLTFASKGSQAIRFNTNTSDQQFRVANTASAVNYVQVTGNATTGTPIISGQGSDTNVNLGFVSKGSGEIRFASNASGSNINFRVLHTTSSAVNYGTVTGAAAGSGPVFSVAGTDTNIDLGLTTKGTGAVKLNSGNGTGLEIADNGATTGWFRFFGGSTTTILETTGAQTNITAQYRTKGTGTHQFNTGGTFANTQLSVSHTASAVNYVQVTGAATGGTPTISPQGSDAAVGLNFNTKGGAGYLFQTNGATRLSVTAGGSVLSGYTNGNPCFTVTGQTSQVNGLQVAGAATGAAPVLSSTGSDTNIDLTLTPKGTGNVRFGTYTASMALTVQGYIEIKDSGGTVRKLAVIA